MYIKVRDTIFEVVEENEKTYTVVSKGKNGTYNISKRYSKVVSDPTDNILDLCDYIHYEINGLGDLVVHIKNFDIEALKECVKQGTVVNVKFSIKSEKGLLFTAYMNKDGDVCLI